jgi:hypothetical protein
MAGIGDPTGEIIGTATGIAVGKIIGMDIIGMETGATIRIEAGQIIQEELGAKAAVAMALQDRVVLSTEEELRLEVAAADMAVDTVAEIVVVAIADDCFN